MTNYFETGEKIETDIFDITRKSRPWFSSIYSNYNLEFNKTNIVYKTLTEDDYVENSKQIHYTTLTDGGFREDKELFKEISFDINNEFSSVIYDLFLIFIVDNKYNEEDVKKSLKSWILKILGRKGKVLLEAKSENINIHFCNHNYINRFAIIECTDMALPTPVYTYDYDYKYIIEFDDYKMDFFGVSYTSFKYKTHIFCWGPNKDYYTFINVGSFTTVKDTLGRFTHNDIIKTEFFFDIVNVDKNKFWTMLSKNIAIYYEYKDFIKDEECKYFIKNYGYKRLYSQFDKNINPDFFKEAIKDKSTFELYDFKILKYENNPKTTKITLQNSDDKITHQLVIFLNDDFFGGEFNFYENDKRVGRIYPKQGKAFVIEYNNVGYFIGKVTGVMYILVADVKFVYKKPKPAPKPVEDQEKTCVMS